MFDCYIRVVEEKGKLIFPEDFCRTRELEDGTIIEDKKALDEIAAELGPYLYAGNYYNNPVSDDLVEFKDEWFQVYDFKLVADKLRNAKCIMSIDPATKDKETNDPTGIVITKIDTDGGVHVVHTSAKRLKPHKVVDEVFDLVAIYDPDVVLIETVSAQILWIDLFNFEMKHRDIHFKLEEYDPGTKESKPIKIRKLIPFYARGQMFHKSGSIELEKQLREFPRNKEDDLIDALQAQVSHWKGTVTHKKRTLIRGSVEWWDELRKGNRGGSGTAEEKLFEEYRPRKPITLREPKW